MIPSDDSGSERLPTGTPRKGIERGDLDGYWTQVDPRAVTCEGYQPPDVRSNPRDKLQPGMGCSIMVGRSHFDCTVLEVGTDGDGSVKYRVEYCHGTNVYRDWVDAFAIETG